MSGLPHLLPYLDPKKVQFVGVRITVVEDATGDEEVASRVARGGQETRREERRYGESETEIRFICMVRTRGFGFQKAEAGRSSSTSFQIYEQDGNEMDAYGKGRSTRKSLQRN